MSLRNAAEVLHRLHRFEEALKVLERAKEQESENPFALDLESQILEDLGRLDPAYEAALLASARDPLNAYMHNRLGVIRNKQKRPDLAINHFRRAVELHPDLFSPAISLASAHLDSGDSASAAAVMPDLQAKARTPSDLALLEHTKARVAFATGDITVSETILKREIASSHNVIPNLGLLVQVECALFDQSYRQFPAIAGLALTAAEDAVVKLAKLDPSNHFIESLRASVLERRQRFR